MAVETHPLIVKNIAWSTEAETQAFAHKLANRPSLAHAFIELRGNLGAGKTTFVRHLLTSLGVEGRIKSPTYAVVEPYSLPWRKLEAWHFDFYRFTDPQEWEEAGFRDIFASSGLKLVEWPDKAGSHLPVPDLLIDIHTSGDDARRVILSAFTNIGLALIA